MSDIDHLPPTSSFPGRPASGHGTQRPLLVRWVGLILMLAGGIAAIAALFSPWLELFKVGDPNVPTKQEYSPWMVLQRGSFDALGVMTGILFLLIAGMVLSSLMFARIRTTGRRFSGIRSLSGYVSLALALAGVVLIGLALTVIPTDLALDYPYYDANVVYGTWLALVGFSSVLIGVGIIGL